MQAYQQKYIDNLKELIALRDFYREIDKDFDSWYALRRQSEVRAEALRRENIRLLEDNLFPLLDTLHDAPAEEITALTEFADVLMDWSTNLDCGVYVQIHDALLSLYRTRKDRDGIIRELYKLGMGLYYLNRSIQAVDAEATKPYYFENEMVFTEASSYFKYFDQISNDETRAYTVRAFANIAICTPNKKRRVAVTSRMISLTQDPYYRNMAPDLPWDSYLRKAYQQMSSNRSILSKGDLTSDELAAIFDACSMVFQPEKAGSNPNVRWLWPYYEMEYSCGFADAETTLNRMEALIDQAAFDQYDVSGLYANIQLPIYYTSLLSKNPTLSGMPRRLRFLQGALQKMMRTFLTFPVAQITDTFLYNITLVYASYRELEGQMSYREISTRLMQRFAGPQYIRSRLVGDLLREISLAVWESDPSFFDDIPFLAAVSDRSEKKALLEQYALDCGLYHDFGRIRMNMNRIMQTRTLFEREYRMYQMHTLCGHLDLSSRPSTDIFADIAWGHHRWYDGSDGYPDNYIRSESPYRQMTDACAVAVYLAENRNQRPETLFDEILSLGGTRFSPLISAVLDDAGLRFRLSSLLKDDGKKYYQELYEALREPAQADAAKEPSHE